MYVHKNSLRSALPILSGILRGKPGRLLVGGQDTKTNGSTTWIRDFPEGSTWYTLCEGAIWHEDAGHGRHTDWSVIEESLKGKTLRRKLLNVIEDARIERAASREFPGGMRPIAAVIKLMSDEGQFPTPNENSHPAQLLHDYCLLQVRAALPYQDFLSGPAAASQAIVAKTFGDGVRIKLAALLKEVPALTSTADALDLSDAILDMLEEESENQPPSQPQPQAGQDASQEQNDQGEDEGESTGQGSGDDGSSGDGAGAGDESGDGSADGSGDPGADGDGSGDAGADEKQDAGDGPQQAQANGASPQGNSTQDNIKKALVAGSDDVDGFDPFETVKDKLAKAAGDGAQVGNLPELGSASEASDNGQVGETVMTNARRRSAQLRRPMQALIESERMDKTRFREVGSMFEADLFPRVRGGDMQVFRHTTRTEAPNTAIQLLVDRSYSMDAAVSTPQGPRKRMDIAMEATVALGYALEGIPGCNLGVTAFPGPYRGPGEHFLTLMKHGERMKAAVKRFGLGPDGGTPLPEAMLYGGFQLLHQREPRKIEIVVTDGDLLPEQVLVVKSLIERMALSGIEVMAIGIGTKSVLDIFPVARAINEASELQSALFDMVKGALLAA